MGSAHAVSFFVVELKGAKIIDFVEMFLSVII